MRQTTRLSLIAAVGLLAACAADTPPGPAVGAAPPTPPAPAAVSESLTINRVVESVNLTERSVLLSGDQQTRLATLRVGPQVRNLAQLRPGDRVQIELAERVAVAMANPGDPATAAAVAATRAPAGARPGGAVAEAERVRVRFESYTPATQTVAFVTPDGQRRSLRLQRPEMQRFASGLRPGDQVDVTLSEAIAVRVTPMRQ